MADGGSGPPPTRVVVVDDRSDPGATVAAVLRAAGFETAVSDDPAVAADAVRLEAVGVVVVAHGTAGAGSTGAVVEQLRAHRDAAVRDVCVVALVDDATGADAALAAGADSVLLRPFEAERLVEAVGDVVRLDPVDRLARRRHR